MDLRQVEAPASPLHVGDYAVPTTANTNISNSLFIESSIGNDGNSFRTCYFGIATGAAGSSIAMNRHGCLDPGLAPRGSNL